MILNILSYHILSSGFDSEKLEVLEITFSSIAELRQQILQFASDRECIPMLDLSADNLHDVTLNIVGNEANLNFQGAMYVIDNFYIKHVESKYKITGEAKAKLIRVKPKK